MAKLTITQKKEIIEQIRQGMKPVDLCKRFGVSASAVRYLIREYAVYGEFALKSAKEKFDFKNSNLANTAFEKVKLSEIIKMIQQK